MSELCVRMAKRNLPNHRQGAKIWQICLSLCIANAHIRLCRIANPTQRGVFTSRSRWGKDASSVRAHRAHRASAVTTEAVVPVRTPGIEAEGVRIVRTVLAARR